MAVMLFTKEAAIYRQSYFVPGLGRTAEAEQHLNSRDISVWSVDIETKDYMFTHLNPDDARKNMIAVMEASLRHNDRGMILMHDIHKNSALALDFIIQKLYNDGYLFVHVKVN